MLEGRDDGVERRRGDDQCADRANRPPGFASVERSAAQRELSEAGGHVARIEVSAGSERNQRQAEDQGAQRDEEGTAARPAARAGIRPERAVQEGVRGRVRRFRRRALRGADRRLRIRPRTGRYRAAGEDLQGRGFGACSVPDGGESGDVQSGQLHVDRRAARYGEDLRQHGVRQVEELPRERGFALRGTGAAAHSDAPAVRQERRDVRCLQLSGRRGRDGPLEVPVGQCGVRAGGAVDQRVRHITAGARRSAAWKAAGW